MLSIPWVTRGKERETPWTRSDVWAGWLSPESGVSTCQKRGRFDTKGMAQVLPAGFSLPEMAEHLPKFCLFLYFSNIHLPRVKVYKIAHLDNVSLINMLSFQHSQLIPVKATGKDTVISSHTIMQDEAFGQGNKNTSYSFLIPNTSGRIR